MIRKAHDTGKLRQPTVKPISLDSQPQSRSGVKEVGREEGLSDGGARRGGMEVGVGESPSSRGLVERLGDGEEGAEAFRGDVLRSTVFDEGGLIFLGWSFSMAA